MDLQNEMEKQKYFNGRLKVVGERCSGDGSFSSCASGESSIEKEPSMGMRFLYRGREEWTDETLPFPLIFSFSKGPI